MTGPLFLPSIEERIKDLERACRRVKHSLSLLQHQDSSYAQDHRALLAAYEEALGVFRRHRDEAVNSGPAVLDEPSGPPCPVCCRPSWPMSTTGRLWRCSGPGCPVSSFTLTDHLPLRSWEAEEALEDGQAVRRVDHVLPDPPLTYDLGTHKVMSMAGVQKLARETFPEGIPDPASLRLLPVPLDVLLPPYDSLHPEDPSHG